MLGLALVACGGSSDEGKSTPSTGGSGGATGGAAGAGGGGGASGGSSGAGGGGGAGGGAGSGGAPSCSLPPLAAGTSKLDITSSGLARTANLVVPKSYAGAQAAPLVLVFHGYLGNAGQMQDITGLDAVAEQNGVVLAYAQGLSTSWNAGKCCGTSASTNKPDVQFVSDLIDAIAQKVCVDPKRVYVTGFSNGAMLSSRLACELSTKIAAFAPVSGPLAIDTCAPVRPMPMIAFHGTSDIVVPYNGGGLGGALSAPAGFDLWKTKGACTDASPVTVFKNGDTTCVEYQQCGAGAAVRQCTIEGGGHQWPGGKSVGIGKVSTDVKASEELMKFFLAHPMP